MYSTLCKFYVLPCSIARQHTQEFYHVQKSLATWSNLYAFFQVTKTKYKKPKVLKFLLMNTFHVQSGCSPIFILRFLVFDFSTLETCFFIMEHNLFVLLISYIIDIKLLRFSPVGGFF